MKPRKLLAAMALLICALLVLSACQSASPAVTSFPTATVASSASAAATATPEPATQPPKLHVTWYVNYDWATGMGKWGDDVISKWMDENKNISIDWVMSGGAAEQKLSTLIVSNDLPDMITTDRGSEEESMVKSGLLAPLDDYYAKYPNFQQWGGTKLVNALRSMIDGKWYGFPSWYTNEKYPLGNAGWAVDKKLYDAEGRPSLETLDDMYAYLKDIKAKYNITPLMIEDFPTFTSSFGEQRIRDLVPLACSFKNGSIVSALSDPEFTDAVLFANKLYTEGLLSGEDFANTSEQRDEKFANGKVPVSVLGDCGNGLEARHNNYVKNDPKGGYEVIHSPIKAGLNRSNVTVSTYALVGWNVTVITKNAKDPERIYAFLDWLTGPEGQTISLFGPQGTYWDNWTTYDGVQVPDLNQDKYKNRNVDDFNKMVNNFSFEWVPNGAWQSAESWYAFNLAPLAANAFPNQTYIRICRSEARTTDEFTGIEPDPTSPEGIAFSTIKDTFNKAWLQAILANSQADAQAILTKANDDVNKVGMDNVLKVLNDNHTKRLALLNQ